MPEAAAPLVAYYGDDMTGSVDVLEGLLRSGLRGALFLDALDEAALARLERADVRAVGIAGMTRTLPAAEIRRTLRPAFAALRATGAPIIHYKMCSTFDSSPDVGSIGAALETAEEVVAPRFVALVPAAPALGRFTAFAHHFARSGSAPEVHRLDRHPTMRRHPVTPMGEADLRRELARQTDLAQGHVDLVAIGAGVTAAQAALDAELARGARVVLFDAVDDAHMATIGAVLWDRATADVGAGAGPLVVAGSAGVEHALGAHWAAAGTVAHAAPPRHRGDAGPILAVAGSRSPVTDAQLVRALQDGFAEVAPPLDAFLGHDGALAARVLPEVVGALAAGRSVVVHSAGGPIAGAPLPQPLDDAGRRAVGSALGAVAEAALAAGAVTRLAVAGGDTSGDVARALGLVAVEAIAPFGPAMPLCGAVAPGRAADGAEVVFKGGQTGTVGFFDEVRRGRPTTKQQEERK